MRDADRFKLLGTYTTPRVRIGERLQRNVDIYRSRLAQSRVSVIPRVGFDVAASCGIFLGPDGAT
jgi:hypothetical protein